MNYFDSKRIMQDLILSIVLGFICSMAVIVILVAAKYQLIDKVSKMINP